MKYNSVEELLAAPDFDQLVLFITKQCQFQLRVSMDEFLHETRIKVFKCVRPHTLKRWEHTSIITKCAIWVYKEMGPKRKKKTANIFYGADLTTVIDNSSSKRIESVDNVDTLEEIFDGNHIDDYSRNLLIDRYIHGKKLGELGDEENTSRENIRQKINNRLKLVKKHSAGCIL